MPKRRRRWPIVVLAFLGCGAALALFAYLFGGEPEPEDELDLGVVACHDGPTTPGIDVSYYQEAIQWKRVRKAGVLFAFIRVSDGSTFPDPRFAQNWQGAGKVGLLRGAYQYFRPEESAVAQADLLITALGRDRGELPPVLDVEDAGGRSPKQISRAIEQWVARVREKLGVEPILYTGPDFWKTRVGNADHTTQPLWLAHYTQDCPTVPAPWTTWTFWQYTDRGKVPGIVGPVDLDVFAGTYAELLDFARRSQRPRAASR